MKYTCRLLCLLFLIAGSSGCNDNEDNPLPVKQYGMLLVYFLDVDKPTLLKVNNVDYTGNLFDAAQSPTSDYCAAGTMQRIQVEVGRELVIFADNGLVKWNLNGLKVTSVYDCLEVGLTGQNADLPFISMVKFSNGSQSGMRNITVTYDSTSAGVLTETSQFPQWPQAPEPSTLVLPAAAGLHTYSAVAQNGQQWQGTFTAKNGLTELITFEKPYALPVPTNLCNIVFNAPGFHLLTVNLEGAYAGTISYTYPSLTPDLCIAKGLVSIYKPVGIYNYTATDLSGNSFSGQVNATTAGGCTVKTIQ